MSTNLAVTNPVGAPTSDEQCRMLSRAKRVLIGAPSQTPTPAVLKHADIGLLYFLNEKQAALHRVVGGTDLSCSQHLEALRLLVEFLSFAVGGLIVEAERIDEAILRNQQDMNDVATELQKMDLELQYRKQRTGSVVNKVLSQHYKCRVNIPTVHVSDQLDPNSAHELQAFSGAILELRKFHLEQKKRRKALLLAQRLLHGTGVPIPAVEAEAIVADLPIAMTFRKVHHSLKDAILPLGDDVAETDLMSVVSLIEFVMHVDVGIGAASDDLDAGVLQIKKFMIGQERNRKSEHLSALDNRNKQLSASAMRYNEAVRREVLKENHARMPQQELLEGGVQRITLGPNGNVGTSTFTGRSETDELLQLYCS